MADEGRPAEWKERLEAIQADIENLLLRRYFYRETKAIGDGEASGRCRLTRWIVLVSLCVGALTGCAPLRGPNYSKIPPPQLAKVLGAEVVSVQVRVGDDRFDKSKALMDAVRSSVEAGLASRGFRIADDGVPVEVKVQHVYWDIEPGFWSRTDSSEIIIRCRVGSPAGLVTFDKTYTGRSGGHAASWEGAEAKEAAFAEVLTQLLADEQLVGALRGAR